MGWELVGVVLAVVALDLIVRASAVPLMLPMLERKPFFNVSPATPDPRGEEVWFPSTHGLTLRGSLYRHAPGTARGLILFCPEMAGSHWSALRYCAGLYRAGFDVFAFDFRSQGESDQFPNYEPLHWVTEYEVADVLAAVAFARQREGLGHLPLGLFGISRGGSAALIAAARLRDVQFVACEGAFATEIMQEFYAQRWAALYVPLWILRLIPDWHLRQSLALSRWVSQLRRRCRYVQFDRWLPRLRNRHVLMIAGERDTYVNAEIPRRMLARIGGPQARLWEVPEARHNLAREVAPEEYDQRLVEFFSPLALRAPTISRRDRPVQDQSDPLAERAGWTD